MSQILFDNELPPIHSCHHCDKFVLDPSAAVISEDGGSLKWAVFQPNLTTHDLAELRKYGCLLGEVELVGGVEGRILYAFEPFDDGRTGFRNIVFGVVEDDDGEAEPIFLASPAVW